MIWQIGFDFNARFLTPNPLKKENKTIQQARWTWRNIFISGKLRQHPKNSGFFSSEQLSKTGSMGDSKHNITQCFIPGEKKRPNNRIGLKATEINVTSILNEILEKKKTEKVYLSSGRYQNDKQ